VDPHPVRQITRGEPLIRPVERELLTPLQREAARLEREEARERRRDREGRRRRPKGPPPAADYRA